MFWRHKTTGSFDARGVTSPQQWRDNSRDACFAVRICAVAIILVTCATAIANPMTSQDADTLKAAQAAYNDGRHQDVIRLLVPLGPKYPAVGDIPRMLTHAYHELGQFDKARQNALAAISVGRLSSDVLGRLAQIDQQRDDRTALLNTVRLLTIVDADNLRWRLIYGDLLAAAKDLQQSATVYRSLLKIQPESSALHLRLGQVLDESGDTKSAVASFETAWHLGAQNSQLPLTIASLWQKLNDEDEALAWTSIALSVGEQKDEALRLKFAQLCWKVGEFTRARQTAEALTASKDENVKAQSHELLGYLAMRDEQPETAVAHWRSAVENGAESPRLLATIGADYFNKGQHNRAAAILQRVVKQTDPPGEQNLRFLIISLIRADQTESARSYLRQYIEHFGLDDTAKKLVGMWTESASGPWNRTNPAK